MVELRRNKRIWKYYELTFLNLLHFLALSFNFKKYNKCNIEHTTQIISTDDMMDEWLLLNNFLEMCKKLLIEAYDSLYFIIPLILFIYSIIDSIPILTLLFYWMYYFKIEHVKFIDLKMTHPISSQFMWCVVGSHSIEHSNEIFKQGWLNYTYNKAQ